MAARLCLMLLVLLVCVRDSIEYDFFVLALQWPPSLCNIQGKNCVPPIKQTFTIHGLWPDMFNGPKPQYCTNTPFDQNQLGQRLTGQMRSLWPNVYNAGKSQFFWSYQWKKHGTCSETVYPLQADYFQIAINMRQRYNLKAILGAANIVPGTGGAYSAASIRSAIQAVTQTVVKLTCNGNPPGQTSQLQEVKICLNAIGNGPIDCQSGVRDNCSQFVTFPI